MGECRFDYEGRYKGTCATHRVIEPTFGGYNVGADPALCTHAAADLEATLAAEKRNHEDDHSRVADLERRLATIIKVIQMHQPVGSPPTGDEAMLAAWVLNVLESRLAQAEAREAAMREALYELWWWYCYADDEPFPPEKAAAVRAALSPAAGRAHG